MRNRRHNWHRACAEALENRRLLTRIAVIGDYSSNIEVAPTQDVSNLVKSWNPDAVVTVGDNNYQLGGADTIDSNIGQWYHEFIAPYTGSFGAGSPSGNRFWPALGNHDWETNSAQPYKDYFTLPNNERYYKTSVGDVDFFIIDSDPREPDGIDKNSAQARWIRQQMLASTAPWKLVVAHQAAFSSSGNHGSVPEMQWPFAEWGADAVLTGHDHMYERLTEKGLTYFVNGLGGRSIYQFATPITGSQSRYNADYGAMRIDTAGSTMTFQFISRTGVLVDTFTIDKSTPAAPARTIIAADSTWKYLDNGSSQGTAWRAIGFSDASWNSGRAELGYGDGGEATVVSSGPDPNNRYTTTYFRKTFNIADAANVAALTAHLVRDDGAVVYLNGTEVARVNMPAGTITSSTFASPGFQGGEESAWVPVSINPALLLNGDNVIAVEIHQSSLNSTDLSFNFELRATLASESAPAAPTALSANPVGSIRVDLSWTDNAINENDFLIERSTDGITFAPIDVARVNESTVSDFGVTAGTTYSYRVRARNSSFASAYSNVASATTALGPSAVTLIPTGSTWKYRDNGSDLGTAWRAIGFPDAGWSSGPAQLGYGDGDEATVVSYGPSINNKYITTYFRKTFPIAYPAQVTALTMRIHRDDSAVVYLNGTEVNRQNMVAGEVTYTTLAASAAEETTYYTVSLNPALLVAGDNVIAVELHQVSNISSDISFELELKATVVPHLAFASGGVLNVQFDGSSAPIMLTGSGGNVVVTRNAQAMTFAGVVSIAAIGTINEDKLTVTGTLMPPLSFSNGVALTIQPGASAAIDSNQQLTSLSASGRFDIRDNAVTIAYSGSSPIGGWTGNAYDGLTGQIAAGRNGGAWSGNGIVTSMTSAIAPNSLTTIGISQTASNVILKYTFAGDINLDGIINGDDYFAIDSGFGASARGYANGDLDYSGTVDADDYWLIDSNYNDAQFPSAPAFAVELASPAQGLFSNEILSAMRRLIEEDESFEI